MCKLTHQKILSSYGSSTKKKKKSKKKHARVTLRTAVHEYSYDLQQWFFFFTGAGSDPASKMTA